MAGGGRLLHVVLQPVLLLCVVYVTVGVHGAALSAEKQSDIEHAIKILEHLTETRKGLTALKSVVADIDTDLQREEKRTCAVSGGMSEHCAAAFLDQQLAAHDWLSSGYSPGKRSVPGPQDEDDSAEAAAGAAAQEVEELISQLGNISRKRKGLDILKRILGEMDADLIYEQKRMCRFNLGGHCATESAASVADQWHYLNSPLSPGRKRRDTRLYNSLIQGKLFR